MYGGQEMSTYEPESLYSPWELGIVLFAFKAPIDLKKTS